MNDSRRRQTTLYAGFAHVMLASVMLAIAAGLPGCGGHGASSEASSRDLALDTASARGANFTTDRAVRQERARNLAAATDDEGPPPRVEARLQTPFLCSRDPVAFDLSALTLGSDAPDGFRLAWDAVRSRTTVPGFVIVYSGTMWGPVITARVGAVRPVTAGLYTFETALVPSETDAITPSAADPFRVRSNHMHRDFVVALGSVREREGFLVSSITVGGRLDPLCQSLRDVSVEVTLPRSNVGQIFGGRTIDAAMGPMTVDTDRDGVPDAWQISLAGDSLSSLMFQL